MAGAIRVEGLREMRTAFRQVDRGMLKEVQAVTRLAAKVVASEASRRAPRLSGALAGSIKGTTSGDRGIVRSKLPYAGVQEFGGTIAPRGTPIHIRPRNFVGGAIDAKAEQIEREMLAGYDLVVRRAGWR